MLELGIEHARLVMLQIVLRWTGYAKYALKYALNSQFLDYKFHSPVSMAQQG